MSALPAAEPLGPDYGRDIVPLLDRYCRGCHTGEDAESGFSVDSFADLQRGGQRGPALVPGRAQDSRMIRLLTGLSQPQMPPEDSEAPTAEAIALLRGWIDAGALGPAGREPERRLVTPRIEPMTGLPRPITALAASPDGQTLAIARFQEVELRRAEEGELLLKIENLTGKVNAVHFSTDGSQLVTASGVTGLSGEAVLWSVEDGRRLKTFVGHDDTLYDAELSPDGTLLATCSYDHRVTLWDVKAGARVRTLEGHNDAVYDLAFSPDGALLATASGDETVKIWHTASGMRLDTLSQPQAEQYVVAFSPDGRYVLGGGADNRIRVWQLVSKSSAEINPLLYVRFAHEQAVTGLAFSPDGKWLVSAAEDQTVKLWTADTFTQTHLFETQPDQVTGLALLGPSRLVLTRMDGTQGRYSIAQHAVGRPAAIRDATTEPAIDAQPANRLIEHEPNDTIHSAMEVLLPATITGRIHGAPGDQDVFRFASQAGQEWIFEVNAARQDSSLDSKLEILDLAGDPVERVWLRAVRDSYFTFRGKDSDTSDDFRLHHWEEMELNEYLYAGGEVVKLWNYPRGPDSGFQVYPGSGKRHTFFDTTAMAHALHEPCYIVVPHAPGSELIANGLPVFTLYYENDDDSLREWGKDSRLLFRAPSEGQYLVRLSDSRGFQGAQSTYQLSIRPRRPDFEVTLEGTNPTVPLGGGQEFSAHLRRIDGFQGEVHIEIDGLPPGFHVTTPLVVEAGQQDARGTIFADSDAQPLIDPQAIRTRITARAMILGREVERPVEGLGEIKLGDPPPLRIRITSANGQAPVDQTRWNGPFELTIAPGETVQAKVLVERRDFDGRVAFGTAGAGRNLPHGVYVDNIGLNGLLIVEGHSERTFFITAAKWVEETSRMSHLQTEEAGKLTSWPVLLHVRRPRDLAQRVP